MIPTNWTDHAEATQAAEPALAAAVKHERMVAARASAEWRAWVARASDGGGGAGHRWASRPTRDAVAAPAFETGHVPMTLPSEIDAARRAVWGQRWNRDPREGQRVQERMHVLREEAIGQARQWPPITAEDVRAALRSLRRTRMLGLDGWHPAQLLALPAEAHDELAGIDRERPSRDDVKTTGPNPLRWNDDICARPLPMVADMVMVYRPPLCDATRQMGKLECGKQGHVVWVPTIK